MFKGFSYKGLKRVLDLVFAQQPVVTVGNSERSQGAGQKGKALRFSSVNWVSLLSTWVPGDFDRKVSGILGILYEFYCSRFFGVVPPMIVLSQYSQYKSMRFLVTGFCQGSLDSFNIVLFPSLHQEQWLRSLHLAVSVAWGESDVRDKSTQQYRLTEQVNLHTCADSLFWGLCSKIDFLELKWWLRN